MRDLKPGRLGQAAEARARLARGRNTPVEKLPPPKVFKKSNPEIPTLSQAQYNQKDYGDSYWDKWPKPEWNKDNKWLKREGVKRIWDETHCVSEAEVEQLLRDIDEGVELGSRGDSRLPSYCGNNKSAIEHAEKLLDMLASWTKSKIISGPFTEEEIRAEFPQGFTVNPIQVAIKPCGKVRPIVDMSSPRFAKPPPPGTPLSVNAGISKSEFPCEMASLAKIAAILQRLKCPAQVTKIDWSDA